MDIEELEEQPVPFSFKLLPQQLDGMRRIAKERQLSIADVTREAVREYLAADAARRVQQEPVAA